LPQPILSVDIHNTSYKIAWNSYHKWTSLINISFSFQTSFIFSLLLLFLNNEINDCLKIQIWTAIIALSANEWNNLMNLYHLLTFSINWNLVIGLVSSCLFVCFRRIFNGWRYGFTSGIQISTWSSWCVCPLELPWYTVISLSGNSSLLYEYDDWMEHLFVLQIFDPSFYLFFALP
jgi:hypothetical protein